MSAFLINVTNKLDRIELNSDEIRIGRDPNKNHILLSNEDQESSREHARLLNLHGRWYLEDYSRNGTYVGQRKIQNSQVPLKTGKHIKIGRKFEYEFHDLHITKPVDTDLTQIPIASSASSNNSRLVVDPDTLSIWRDGQKLAIRFAGNEGKLFFFLYKNSDRICTYPEIMQAVWAYEVDPQNINELIQRVRKKIEPDYKSPTFLITHAGIGLCLLKNP